MKALSLILLCYLALGSMASAETFSATDVTLKDRAYLVKLPKGARRARLLMRDEASNTEKVVLLAHVDGRAGLAKLQVPDDVPIDKCRAEISLSDPFPYEYYRGKSDFPKTELLSDARAAGGIGAPTAAEDKGGQSSANTVQESDLWQWSGRRLYFFNQLRGLQVFDLSNMQDPLRIATLRLPAVGEQMYLLDSTHVLLITNQPNLQRNQSDIYGPWWSQSTEVIMVALNNRKLEVQQKLALDGYYVESRLVGNRLYVISQFSHPVSETVIKNGQTIQTDTWRQGIHVNQIDLSNPSAPMVKKPLDLTDSAGAYWNAVVQATPEYLLVAPSYYNEKDQATRSRVNVIPIGPERELKVAAEVELKAQLSDKFKLRLENGILTTVTQSFTWREQRKTFVQTFDLNNNGAVLGLLTLAPQETLFATRFDGDRLYVVTFLLKDPLFVVDLKDPKSPTLLGELVIPGWSTYLVPERDRLLSIGVEGGRVAVSLFDVSDPKRLSQLRRVYPGSEWSGSEANWDEKAVGYLPEQDLLLLPINTTVKGEYKNFMQLIDVKRDTLSLRGAIEHQLQGRRATAFDSYVVSISGRELLVVDATDRDKPNLVQSLSLAWPVDRVLSHKSNLLQLESSNEWDLVSNSILRVSLEHDPDALVAELSLGQGAIRGAVLSNDRLYVLRQSTQTITVQANGANGDTKAVEKSDTVYALTMDVIDLSEISRPRIIGSHTQKDPASAGGFTYPNAKGLLLPSGHLAWLPVTPRYRQFPLWRDALPMAGLSVIFDRMWWYPTISVVRIPIYDISVPDRISLASNPIVKFPDAWEVGPTLSRGSDVFFSYKNSTVKESAYLHHYELIRVDLSDVSTPRISSSVNIPGLVDGVYSTADGGLVLFSTSPKFRASTTDDAPSSEVLIQASVFDGNKAYLVDEVTLPDGRYTPTTVYDRFVLKGIAADKAQGISVLDWSSDLGKFAKGPYISTTYSPSQFAIEGNRLLSQAQNMIDVVALEDLALPPRMVSSYYSGQIYNLDLNLARISADGGTLWVPTGPFGVEKIDISALSPTRGIRVAAQVEDNEWSPVDSKQLVLVYRSGDDIVGKLNEGESWKFRGFYEVMSYEAWMAAHLNPAADPGWIAPSIAVDLDQDGVANGLEYLWDMDPAWAGETAPLPTVSTVRLNDGRYLAMNHWPITAADKGMTVVPEYSMDLATWSTLPQDSYIIDRESAQLRLRSQLSDMGKIFLRCQVQRATGK